MARLSAWHLSTPELLRNSCRGADDPLLCAGAPAVQDAPLGGYSDAFAAQQRLPVEVAHRARMAGAPTLAPSKI